jgi:2-polyprenyl-6-methoxyphenol hydroxylase-like FAD-dependent oxidoreductase
MFPVGRQRIYWGIGKREPEGGTNPTQGLHQLLHDHLREFPEMAHQVVTATPAPEIIRTDIYDRDPEETWVKGRVALLGDAAHMTTPFVGQGAGISMEDGVRLSKELALTDGLRDQRMLAHALEAYEQARMDRCAKVVLSSRRRGKVLFWRNRELRAVRNAGMRCIPASARHSMLASSIDYEV